MFLVGDVTVISAEKRKYEDREYFRVTSIGSDKSVYIFSCGLEVAPQESDVFQMYVESGSDCKARTKFQKVK